MSHRKEPAGSRRYEKKRILRAIVSLAKKLGHTPSREEFIARSGISAYFVLQSFYSWNDAVSAAGLRPYTLNVKVKDRALLEDWGEVVRRNRAAPAVHIYRRKGKYNPGTLIKRFGPWTTLPEVFCKFARPKPEWRDVLALLANSPSKKELGRPRHSSICASFAGKNRSVRLQTNPQGCRPALQHSPDKVQHAPFKDRPTYGNPLPLPEFRHEPVNEQGVVLLFGMLAKDLGYLIEAVQKGFPDCEAKREVAPGRWQRVRIEFEYESKNFHDHGHPVTGCDIIVCWRHNWEECPKYIEIVELSSIIKSLGSYKT